MQQAAIIPESVIISREVWETFSKRLAQVEDFIEAVKTMHVEEPIFTVSEAAEYLRIHPESVREARREKRIHGFKINEKQWGFRKSELDRYLNRYNRDR